MPDGVRADVLADPGATGDPPDDAGGAVPVHPPSVGAAEERAFGALIDGQVDRPCGAGCQRDGDHFAALAGR
jgi:hypothetical protein